MGFLHASRCLLWVLPVVSCATPDAAALRLPTADLISRTDQAEAGRVLREVLETTGRANLKTLAGHADPMVALHSIWEREKLVPGEKVELVAAFEERLGIRPPLWWQGLLEGVVVYETCHYFPRCDSWWVRTHEPACPPYEIVARPGFSGSRFAVELRDTRTGATVWKNEVWAAGRTEWLGPQVGAHQVELIVTGTRLFVFGVESHGAYAESFRLSNGDALFRFCSCYWFDCSEEWPSMQTTPSPAGTTASRPHALR